MTEENTKSKEKKKKKKGPFRTEAIIPVTIIIVLIVVFNIFFLDSVLKTAIEKIGENVNGAEVNVASVETSFSNLRFTVKNIQVTNKEVPTHNKTVIGLFNFQMTWDALLRGKVLIDKAQIGGILINTKRNKPGYVLPEPPPADTTSAKAKEVLGKAKKEFDGNVFGDIAGVLGGGSTGDVKDDIKKDLASTKGFEELNKKIEAQKKDLDAKIKAVPSEKDLKELNSRLGKIKWSDLGNITKAPKVLKEADDLRKDIEKANKSIQAANKAVNTSIKTMENSYKEANKLVEEDIANISKRMNLPSLDPKSIAQMLFGDDLIGKLNEVRKYQDMAKQYMPKKKEDRNQPVKRPRGVGKNYQFGTPTSYPLFWLKLASIDSKTEQGTVAGKIENITTNQKQIGKITTANITADFPGIEYRDIKADIALDHREAIKLEMDSSIGSFPITDKALSKSKDVTFVLEKAQTNTVFNVVATQKDVNLKLNNTFSNIQYKTEAKSKQVDELIDNVAKRTPKLTLDAKGKGAWDDIKFDIKSNLAQAIKSATEALVQEKINQAKAKIKADVERQIAAQKKQVDDKINGIKKEVDQKLAGAKNQLAKLQGDLDKEKKSAEKKAKKGAKDLFKGIKGIKL